MSMAILANWYLCANALIVLAALMSTVLHRREPRARPGTASQRLGLGYGLLLSVLLLPLLTSQRTDNEWIPPVAQVWSAASMQQAVPAVTTPAAEMFTLDFSPTPVSLNAAVLVSMGVLGSGLFVCLLRWLVEFAQLQRLLRNALVYRRSGRVRVLISDTATAPFACWLPGRAMIVIPSPFLSEPLDLRLILRHEGQHHRQSDTRLIYLLQLFTALFYWNPFAHLLLRHVCQCQELSCDQAVVAKGRGDRQAYCHCLLRMAEVLIEGRPLRVVPGLMGSGGGFLQHRVEALLASPRRTWSRAQLFVTVGGLLPVLMSLALFIGNPVADYRVDAAEAKRLMDQAQQGTVIPLVINDAVLRELNLLLGTPDGRAWLQASLQRMGTYQDMMETQLETRQLPAALLAVPLVESGFRNLPDTGNPGRGAGLWMFLQTTASQMGLEVEAGGNDERLDTASATAAALRYMEALHSQFNDWPLTLLAYNVGSGTVQKRLATTAEADAWALFEQGLVNDAGYLSRVMAAIIILHNSNSLNLR